MKEKRNLLEAKILEVQEKGQNHALSIHDVMALLSGKGRPLLVMLISLPFCLPIQIPGLSTPFGLFIAFVGLRLAFGQDTWLPEALLRKTIEPKTIKKITEDALWLIRKLKPWVYSRLTVLCDNRVGEIVHGMTIAGLGIFLALPLPIPLSNFLAAWSLFFISLGLMETDGLMILIGYLIAISSTIALIFMLVLLKGFFA